MDAPTRMPMFFERQGHEVPARARCALGLAEPGLEGGHRRRRHMEAPLRSAPEDILRRDRPFLPGQILDLAARRDHRPDGGRDRSSLRVAQQPGDPGAIGARVAARQIRRQPGRSGPGPAQALEIGIGNIAAGQGRRMGPGRPAAGEMRLQLLQRMLGQLAKRRDLAAEDRQQGAIPSASSSSST